MESLNSITITVLIISMVLQLCAAGYALMLTRRTQSHGPAWLFIAMALLLMAGRRMVTLVAIYAPTLGSSGMFRGPVAELLALVIALLMVVGVLQMPQIFRALEEQIRGLGQQLADLEQRLVRRERAHRRVRAAMDSSPMALGVVSSEGRIAHLAGHDLEALGVQQERLLDQPVSVLYTLAPWLRMALEQAMLGDATEAQGQCNGRWLRVNLTPLHDAGRWSGGVALLAVDFTAQVEKEQALRRTLEGKVEADRGSLQARQNREELVALASRELREPLGALQLAVQGMVRLAGDPRSRSGRPEVLRRSAEVAEQQLSRLMELAGDLFDISWGPGQSAPQDSDVGERHALDLVDLLYRVCGALEELAQQRGCALYLHTPVPVVGLWNEASLERLLTKLLRNALEFGAGFPVEVDLTLQGREAHLEVRDFGVGISEAGQEALFGAPAPGLSDDGGRGMYIVRRIVEGHGGRISVSSLPGHGATFQVRLPLSPSGPRAGSEALL